MNAKFFHACVALVAIPALAQDFAVTGSHGVYTAVPLQTPELQYRSNLPWRELKMIEDALTNRAQSAETLWNRARTQLAYFGGLNFIKENEVDPRQFNDPVLRAKYAPVIDAIEFDTRLSNLIEDLDAAIADEDKQAQTEQKEARQKAWADAVEESRVRARTIYPDIYFPDSRLSKKWLEVRDQMQKAGTISRTPDAFFLITVRAANLLGIKPISP
jgi:hypothetical protein